MMEEEIRNDTLTPPEAAHEEVIRPEAHVTPPPRECTDQAGPSGVNFQQDTLVAVQYIPDHTSGRWREKQLCVGILYSVA